MDSKTHWETVYQTKAAHEVSWYRSHLDKSLALIVQAAPDPNARIIDIGGGEATLVDDLIDRGYQHLSILDISQAAIDTTRKRLGAVSVKNMMFGTIERYFIFSLCQHNEQPTFDKF
jgi:2-polyprenyl-3-methyl-5-hydroxy-6-metoxy-1,4-benzoquinol methylase